MIRTGTILSSRYEILEQIGSGGMAYVYKARDRKLSRLVAIKILKEEFCKDKSFVAKFRMEAQAAAGLIHPAFHITMWLEFMMSVKKTMFTTL